ncbi:MAG: NAD(P)H-quinone oxidoreductase [Allobranchiibius sp.]
MKAITLPEFGDPDVMTLAEVPNPVPRSGEVLVQVTAAGVNRADLAQRMGNYPPPPGGSQLPGLEVSGTIATVGEGVDGWQVGDEVCALLAGGGYAEQVAVPVGQLLPVPKGVSLVDAAALPEVACTVWSNVFMVGHLKDSETFLVHGGSSGIGTMAIQLAHAFGARVATTAGSPEKLNRCRELGADILIDYHEEDFVEVLDRATEGHGADVILDGIGGSYLARNVTALAEHGRLVTIGMLGGAKGELNLGQLLRKWGSVSATGLRSRPPADKAAIVADVRAQVWPLIEAGRVRPIVHARLPLSEAAKAHRILDESSHIGKVLLTT